MRYRKKPVVIEAAQWDGSDAVFDQVEAWATEGDTPVISKCRGSLFIGTLEGEMEASPGDWIIRGVRRELYPIKDTIFRETYEPADD